MIKDLPASLIAAATEINKKSREAFHAEQAAMEAKKKPKMPMQPTPKAEPAAVSGAGTKMAEEAGGTVPKTPSEKKLAALSGNPKVITKGDVLKGRGVKSEEAEVQQEGWDDMLKDVKEKSKPQPNGGSGVKAGTRYGGSKQKKTPEEVKEGLMATLKKISQKAVKTIGHGSDEDMRKDLQKKMGLPQTGKKPVKENMDTPGNSTHQCAIHVKSEQYGEGRCLTTQHAEPVNGFVEWYDVMFAEGIKRVNVADVEVLEAMMHGHATKKKAK